MFKADDYRLRIKAMEETLSQAKYALDIDNRYEKLKELRAEQEKPEVWQDLERSAKIGREISSNEGKIASYEACAKALDDANEIIDLIEETEEEELVPELDKLMMAADKDIEELRIRALLRGKYDSSNALMSLHAGAGGTEACDWCQMLYRMYCRYAEMNGFKVTEIDRLAGDGAGLKSVDFKVEGENAYGYLKGEHGVHRLVRVSPFDASGRRHTSFAAVEVMPEITDGGEIELRDEDIKMDVFRSSGAGGQKVNKTSSAVRLTHLPTGIVVSSQVERSHFPNLENCKDMLRARLAEIKEREHLEKISDIKGVQMKIDFGSAIRSYVFMPYTLAKDARTGYENSGINGVMDGDIDGFINAFLSMNVKK